MAKDARVLNGQSRIFPLAGRDSPRKTLHGTPRLRVTFKRSGAALRTKNLERLIQNKRAAETKNMCKAFRKSL
jgi:hypothetical protein